MSDNKFAARGSLILEDLKVGEIFYESARGQEMQLECLTAPAKDESDMEFGAIWEWTAKNILTGKAINYRVMEKYSHYSDQLSKEPIYWGATRI